MGMPWYSTVPPLTMYFIEYIDILQACLASTSGVFNFFWNTIFRYKLQYNFFWNTIFRYKLQYNFFWNTIFQTGCWHYVRRNGCSEELAARRPCRMGAGKKTPHGEHFRSAGKLLPIYQIQINLCQIQINLCQIQINLYQIQINLCQIQINLCQIQINLCQIQINLYQIQINLMSNSN